jgi:ribosomal-protein-alanine N-acetyltransferase
LSSVEILTDSLRLVVSSPEQTRARIESMPPEDRAQVSPAWLAAAMAAPTANPWIHGFTIFRRSTGAPIGNCGFKGPPTTDGRVEIAYGLDEEYWGRGYATEAARALTAFALDADDVRTVIAHTLPEENASARVLRKSGFEWVGDVVDPEDGPVWRWEFRLAAKSGERR